MQNSEIIYFAFNLMSRVNHCSGSVPSANAENAPFVNPELHPVAVIWRSHATTPFWHQTPEGSGINILLVKFNVCAAEQKLVLDFGVQNFH